MPEAKDAPRDDHLLMFRPTLNDLPELSLPSGATIRHSHPDEGPAWEGIVNAAFPEYPLTFAKMRGDMAYTPERILFLEEEGRPVATASAWRKPEFGPDCGYLHWVGTHPDFTGKGYGRLLTIAALLRMRSEGCICCVLNTRDFRVAAINIYLKLGFHICMDSPTLPRRWAAILETIGSYKK